MIGRPNDVDLENIVKAWHPNLEPLAGKLIGRYMNIIGFLHLKLDIAYIQCFCLAETLEKVNSAPQHHFVKFQSGNSACLSSLSRFSLR